MVVDCEIGSTSKRRLAGFICILPLLHKKSDIEHGWMPLSTLAVATADRPFDVRLTYGVTCSSIPLYSY